MRELLKLKTVNDLLGLSFFIPAYQRGYRWTSKQVNDLLDDIWQFVRESGNSNSNQEFYCLQPVVVKNITPNNNDIPVYEVVDGQQRLTTIYLIIKYLAKAHLKVESIADEYKKDLYTLCYATRVGSEEYLQDINEDNSNIDYHYIYSAYKTIENWFKSDENTIDRTDRDSFLGVLLGKKDKNRSVQVIWYEVDEKVEGVDIFTRLNIGKIPLTNSELIKALFLSESSFSEYGNMEALRKKVQIAQIWDSIEQSLNEEDFWAFVTNRRQAEYATKMEMLLDTISGKKVGKSDPYHTFLYFLKKSNDAKDQLWESWLLIEKYYLTLREWYKNKNLYHKVGFLIACGENLSNLVNLSLKSSKSIFEEKLDEKIREKVNTNLHDLSYENQSDHKLIKSILLLFNIESIRTNEKTNEYYPFKFHKNVDWSIEHIHAQNTDGLDRNKKAPWSIWLKEHRKLIEEMADDPAFNAWNPEWQDILDKLRNVDHDKISWEAFSSLSEQVIRLFTEEYGTEKNSLHSLSNLTLLGHSDNSALSNSVFEVKRRQVIKFDIEGRYLPICTRRVFLKYYNEKPSGQQTYYWGKDDQLNYLTKIEMTLAKYLPDESEVVQDEEESA